MTENSPVEEDRPIDSEEQSFEQSHTSRRNFMIGAGTAATMMGGGYATQDQFREAVRDEPAKGGKVRHLDVHAIEVDIVYNAFGVHQPNSAMYVLEKNKEAVREASGEIPGRSFDLIEDDHDIDHSIHQDCDGNHEDEDKDDSDCDCHEKRDRKKPSGVDTSVIQPLVIRANVGDVNDLDRRVSIHQTALLYDVQDSDGMSVGFNEDTTVAPNDSITYRWFASNTGTHFFYDGANQAYDSADEPPQRRTC